MVFEALRHMLWCFFYMFRLIGGKIKSIVKIKKGGKYEGFHGACESAFFAEKIF